MADHPRYDLAAQMALAAELARPPTGMTEAEAVQAAVARLRGWIAALARDGQGETPVAAALRALADAQADLPAAAARDLLAAALTQRVPEPKPELINAARRGRDAVLALAGARDARRQMAATEAYLAATVRCENRARQRLRMPALALPGAPDD